MSQTAQRKREKMQVSKETTIAVSEALDKVISAEFKKRGLLTTNKKSKYGDEFRYQVDGYAKDESEISRELSRELMDAITPQAKEIFAQHNLERKKVSGKYGAHFRYIITADPVQVNKKGINVASQMAQDFIFGAWQYGFTPEDAEKLLGEERIINNKSYILIGLQVGRKMNKLIVKSRGEEYLLDERAITKWGGELQTVGNKTTRVS